MNEDNTIFIWYFFLLENSFEIQIYLFKIKFISIRSDSKCQKGFQINASLLKYFNFFYRYVTLRNIFTCIIVSKDVALQFW